MHAPSNKLRSVQLSLRVNYPFVTLGSLGSYDSCCNENISLHGTLRSEKCFATIPCKSQGEKPFRLFGTKSFHAKAKNEIFTAVGSRCRQKFKYENFTSSFGRLRQKIEPKSMPHVQHDYRHRHFLNPIQVSVTVTVTATVKFTTWAREHLVTLNEILTHLIEGNPGISDSTAKKFRLCTFFTQKFLPGRKQNKYGP